MLTICLLSNLMLKTKLKEKTISSHIVLNAYKCYSFIYLPQYDKLWFVNIKQ